MLMDDVYRHPAVHSLLLPNRLTGAWHFIPFILPPSLGVNLVVATSLRRHSGRCSISAGVGLQCKINKMLSPTMILIIFAWIPTHVFNHLYT
jgi:hypothetical protein